MSKSSDHLTERSLVNRCVRAIPITHSVAMAAGQDAGNRLMRKGSRKAWSRQDYNAAARESCRIALAGGLITAAQYAQLTGEPA